jgi:hypothetical protein
MVRIHFAGQGIDHLRSIRQPACGPNPSRPQQDREQYAIFGLTWKMRLPLPRTPKSEPIASSSSARSRPGAVWDKATVSECRCERHFFIIAGIHTPAVLVKSAAAGGAPVHLPGADLSIRVWSAMRVT